MLLRFKIKNFLSFYDETDFDMFANPKRELFPNHINTSGEIPLLKQALIYGPNGSGKSNFIKAISFLRSFVSKEEFLKENYSENKFQLVKINKKPIAFEIEFYNKEYYIYKVSISDNIKEELYISGLGEKEDDIIFERNGSILNTPVISKDDKMRAKELIQNNKLSSVIPLAVRFPIIERKHIDNVYEWFKDKVSVITINSGIPFLIQLLSLNKDMFRYCGEMLRKLKITDGFEISEMSLEKWISNKGNGETIKNNLMDGLLSDRTFFNATENHFNTFSISINKRGQKMVKEFIFKQIGVDNYEKGMNVSSQSDGTKRLLTLLPAFYLASKGGVLFIDEIENSMHPDLIYKLVKHYSDGKSKGQLIFTTHLTKFQNQQELVRPDEVWKTEKINGQTRMRCFNDYKIHNTINMENGYNLGRYGGVPNIEDL